MDTSPSGFPKLIKIKLEPLEEPVEITVEATTTVQEIIDKLIELCKGRNIDINSWAKSKLGTDNFALLFMRKGLDEDGEQLQENKTDEKIKTNDVDGSEKGKIEEERQVNDSETKD